MELNFSPEIEAELKRAALERDKQPNSECRRSSKPILTMTSGSELKYTRGLAQLNNEESVSHDEVAASIERMFPL